MCFVNLEAEGPRLLGTGHPPYEEGLVWVDISDILTHVQISAIATASNPRHKHEFLKANANGSAARRLVEQTKVTVGYECYDRVSSPVGLGAGQYPRKS